MSSTRWWLFRLGIGLALLSLVLLVGGASLMWCLNFYPDPVMEVGVHCKKGAPKLEAGEKISLLSWNIQYAASRNYHFWYDGGEAVHVKERHVHETLETLAKVISTRSPQILLLQEVDRDSARTHRIDQLPALVRANAARCWASTTYHRSRYVPAPLSRPLGRVDMHLATASTFKMSRAQRHALPQLDEFFVRKAFNLKRAILEVHLPIKGKKQPLVLLNTHLSAFSFGDGTLNRQVQKILKRIQRLEDRGAPWILAGDLNMIPPGEDPARLGGEAHHYSDKNNPLVRLFKRFQVDTPLEEYKKHPSQYYTYLRYGNKEPDRKIDYIFTSQKVRIHEFKVLLEKSPASDHLPLWMVFSVAE